MSTTTAPRTGTGTEPPGTEPVMSHRQIMEALSGLLLGLFVAILSSTVVSNALPRIITELKGSQSGYTWVVASTLLATTASTPIWGKLADLMSKKLLVQLSLVVFVLGSLVAGLSQSIGVLIVARVIQGLGAGGLTALTQVCMAAMIPPRERGRYSGYLGAVLAVATVAGPLIGGVIVDTSWLGWRWCFGVGVPFAVVAIIVLQKTLHLPTYRRDDVRIDWLGATVVTGAVSLLLIWISLAGTSFDWASWQTALMVGGALLLGVLAVMIENRAAEPIIPLSLFRHRSISLAVVASLFVGIAMFGATVFLSQYFQISRGDSPTQAGLSTVPLILGLSLSSLVSGRIITRTGKWKRFLVGGSALIVVGFAAMGTIDKDTPYWFLAVSMAVIGIGLGATMQNLVLSVQNAVPVTQLGAASSTVAFFRSLGGAIGVSALGAVLGHQVSGHIASGLTALGLPAGATGGGSQIPNLATLPAPVARVVQESYGIGAGDIFLVAAPLTLLALIAVLFIREVPLRTSNVLAQEPAGPTKAAADEDSTGAARAADAGSDAGTGSTRESVASDGDAVGTTVTVTVRRNGRPSTTGHGRHRAGRGHRRVPARH
ncbi:MFS transporter [Nakamurella flavida]|uniref:MFS transporter n=1 Tax=Nakamurella flavida TaxID=363630 RepID=A0A938YLQ2_9ACTN|nr:MDR family MFS transporter [Nakamurella flavida]MBM9476846.1 MFS transporter [Nakamurella flavida]MDP9778711.1 EmrB/QacA subfamily drug resistance transporter [Nakamurella flavida]